jgi:hypothetical protein
VPELRYHSDIGNHSKKRSEDSDMNIESPHELFVLLLSDVRQGTERTTQIFQDFSKVTQNADVKEALDARVFASQRVVEKLDECFKLIGEHKDVGGVLHRIRLYHVRRTGQRKMRATRER